MATKTPAPSGFTVRRNGNKFVVSWKIQAKNSSDGQVLKFKVNGIVGGKWRSLTLGKNQTTQTITTNGLYDSKTKKSYFRSLEIQVQNNAGGANMTPSKWAGITYKASPPLVPTVTSSVSTEQKNMCSFSWGHGGNAFGNTDSYWFLKAHVETTAHPQDEKDDWVKVDATQQSGTITYRESTVPIAKKSYIRKFRVRYESQYGFSAWKTAYHVYAIPYVAQIKSAVMHTNEFGSIIITATWNTKTDMYHPSDRTNMQYGIAVPGNNMSCPDDISWVDRPFIKDTSGDDADSFVLDSTIDDDKCVFVRVLNYHDQEVSYSPPMRVTGIQTKLSKPIIGSITPNYDTCRTTFIINNESAVPDSKLAVIYRETRDGETTSTIIGIYNHGDEPQKIIQCPDIGKASDFSFGVYAFAGDAEVTKEVSFEKNGITYTYNVYTLENVTMKSDTVWQGGDVPKAPQNVRVTKYRDNVATVTWSWDWASADIAELSWSDHDDAWESTNQPDTYRINSTNTGKWNIHGLESGTTWYIRVRLIKLTDDGENPGPWSDIVPLDMTSAPVAPVINFSKETIAINDTFTVSWEYESLDGTDQASAELSLATINGAGEVVIGDKLPINITTNRSVDIIPSSLDWENGNRYGLVLKVISASGRHSDWSTPRFISISEPLVCSITSTSLTADNELKTMPLTLSASVSGGSENGSKTSIIIEREEGYFVDRPDETTYTGYEGETILSSEVTDLDNISIEISDLIGTLDDSAKYRMYIQSIDDLGQISVSDAISFIVNWTHQAPIPTAHAELDEEYGVVKITPTVDPSKFEEGDTVDIYRLSIDKPVLIVKGGSFGTTYVDPYPTIGEYGGHRIVGVTANGDFISNDEQSDMSWIDLDREDGDYFESDASLINYDAGTIEILYNVSFSNKWTKNFKETRYLGGHIQGDWNAGVSRTGSINTVTIRNQDQETITALRRLAEYPGICHIRTLDGSNFYGDIQVNEDLSYDSETSILNTYSFDITRVDSSGLDGMTLEEWNKLISDESFNSGDITG